MKELTFEEFCNLPYKYVWGISGDTGAHRVFMNEEFGIQIDIVTKRKVRGDIYSDWELERRIYSLYRDKRDFDTPDQVYVAYMEKACGIEKESRSKKAAD